MSVHLSIHRSVRPSVGHTRVEILQKCRFDQNYWQYERERILCRVYGLVLSRNENMYAMFSSKQDPQGLGMLWTVCDCAYTWQRVNIHLSPQNDGRSISASGGQSSSIVDDEGVAIRQSIRVGRRLLGKNSQSHSRSYRDDSNRPAPMDVFGGETATEMRNAKEKLWFHTCGDAIRKLRNKNPDTVGYL